MQFLKRKRIILWIISVLALSETALTVIHSNGVGGYTNAPGETTCTDCHTTYPLNSPGGSISINISSNVTTYVGGQTYTVGVTIKRPGPILFGVDCEVLDSTGANAGAISLINTSTTILINALIGANNRTNVAHYGGVFASDSCTFYFKWIAPANNKGNITIYTAGNASNGDSYTAGDYIYTSSKTLTPDPSMLVAEKNNDFSFHFYPSPAERNVTLSYYLFNESMINVELISMNGKNLKTLFNGNGRIGNNFTSINLPSDIVSGTYFIRLTQEGRASTSLIMVK